jgi:hypothetical protein
VFLDRHHLLGAALGLSVGGVVYRLLIADWYFALAVAALYAGVAYFYLAFDISLLDTHVQFGSNADALGYAAGLFGLSLGPLALGQFTALGAPAVLGTVVWAAGMIAFLTFTMTAATRRS